MKTLSKLTIDDLEKPKPFSLFPELETEYRIKKITALIFNRYYLQFKDNYRIFGLKTPLKVWRFIPLKGNWKRSNCPVIYGKKHFMVFISNTDKIEEFMKVYYSSDKAYLRKFTKVYPNIDFYLNDLSRAYHKKNDDNTEYL